MSNRTAIKQRTKSLVFIIPAVAALGGLLFGFDIGIVSGAIPYFQKKFEVDDSWVELITTSGLVGAVIGAMFCGWIADRTGRKKVILAAALFFVAGSIWSGLAPDAAMLMLSRFFLGIAIGLASTAVPLYIAEISPARLRGMLVASFQLLITVGIMVSYFINVTFALPEGAPGYEDCWRPMFYSGVIPAVLLFAGTAFLPESPRWLMSKGNERKCREILGKVEETELVNSAIAKMKEEIVIGRVSKGQWRMILEPWLRIPLMIALGIMFMQQFTGINTIIYYSPKIFLMSGFDGSRAAIVASVSVGVVTVLFTLLSLFMVDRLGRRKLYFTGLGGMVIALLALGAAFAFYSVLGHTIKQVAIVLVWIYVAFYCISLGPLGWLIISEIFPLKIRGIGSSIGSFSCWVFNSIVAFTFFKIVKAFTLPGTGIILENNDVGNPAGAFWFYALIGIAGLIWGYHFIPETKGKSLEQIEEHWRLKKLPKEL